MLRILLPFFFSFVFFVSALKAETSPVIPEPLKAWVPWVQERDLTRECATSPSGKWCQWPGKLYLALAEKGGTFSYAGRVDQRGFVPLPGGSEIFPSEVVAGEKPISVVLRGGVPFAQLESGSFDIRGRFAWESLPKTLSIPRELGILSLEVSGKIVSFPKVTQSGQVWLRDDGAPSLPESEGDSLRLEVYRLLEDDVPFKITTALKFRVSGKAREISFGKVLLPEATPVAVISPLPYQLSGSNEVTVQARPGVWEMRITSYYSTPPETLAPVRNQALTEWPAEEIWAFLPNETLRTVSLEGGNPVEPERTSLPDDWKGHRTFILSPEETLELKELRRGERDRAPNALALQRQIWLDLEGEGFTVRDQFNGTLNQKWRLNALPELILGSVNSNGQDQLITKDPHSGYSGFEVRDQALQASANSRIEQEANSFSSIGWDLNVNALSSVVLLPPGWTLFHAAGPDQVGGSWTRSWTLLDMFVLILIAVGTWKLLGKGAGIAAFLALTLAHAENLAPSQVWFHLLASLALARYLPESSFRTLARAYYYVTLFLVCLVVLIFSVEQLRAGLFPQTGALQGFLPGVLGFFFEIAESSIIGWIMVVLLGVCAFLGFMALVQGEIRRFFKFAALGILVLILGGVAIALSYSGVRESPYYNEMGVGDGMMPETATLAPQSAPYDEGQYSSSEQDTLALRSKGGAFMGEGKKRLKVFKPDPKAVIQTGPGLPTWNWRAHSLNWRGSVGPDERLELWLISPALNLLLACIKVALFIFLCLAFSRQQLSRVAAILIMGVVIGWGTPRTVSAQEYPSESLLQELHAKLKASECLTECSTINSARFVVTGSRVELSAQVSSIGAGAIALPGPAQQLLPIQVKIDGTISSALRKENDGVVWLRVPEGVHEVEALFSLTRGDLISIQFPQKPLAVEVDAPEWDIDGLSPTRYVTGSLQLTRKALAVQKALSTEESPEEAVLSPWFVISRDLVLDIPWYATTTVKRLGDTDRPYIVKVPLIAGESVTSDEVTVEKGFAVVSFARGESSVSWESTLTETESFAFEAGTVTNQTESWFLSCSPMWRCEYEGLTPSSTSSEGKYEIAWRPFPGEKVTVMVTRPSASPGQAITIDSVRHEVTPGRRILSGNLVFSVRASQGGFQNVGLPQGARLSRVVIGGREETSRFSKENLAIPLAPGVNNFEISYEMDREQSLIDYVPEVALSSSHDPSGEKSRAYNITVNLKVPESRWLIWTMGPSWGPAVLFWSKLIMIVIGAVLISRVSWSPLSLISAILLGLGLATLSIPQLIIPIAWLFLLELRRRKQFERPSLFNLSQIVLACLTLSSIGVLYQAVRVGLVFSPDMIVSGNGSSNYDLVWYADQAYAMLPSPGVVWLPLLVWHLVMVCWSIWLVFSLFRWLVRGFQSFTTNGIWKRREAVSTVQS